MSIGKSKRKKRHSKRCLSLLILSTVLLTGCWDRVEIEDRGFVVAIGLDITEDGQFQLTQQLAVPGGMSGSKGSGGGMTNQKPGQAFINIVGTGPTVLDIIRHSSAKVSRNLFYEHMKVIVVSKKLAKSHSFAKSLNFFIRAPQMRRETKVIVSDGAAMDVLNLPPRGSKVPGLYIDKITESNYRNESIVPPTRMGQISEAMYKKQSFVVQHVAIEGDVLNIEGAAVFRNNNRLAGILTPSQTAGLSFIKGNTQNGIITSQYKGKDISLVIDKSKQSIQADISDPAETVFNITVTIDGATLETGETSNFIKAHNRNEVEKAFEKVVDEKMNEVVQLLQTKFLADILGLGQYIRIHNWPLWQQIKTNWDKGQSYFTKAKINVKAIVHIRNTGVVERTGT